MSKFVMVTAISQFRMRYVVEVPESFSGSPADYAKDTVVCDEAVEFSQEYLGETIIDSHEVDLELAVSQYRIDNPAFSAWSDQKIIETGVTDADEDSK